MPEGKAAKARHDRFRVHARKGRAGTMTTPSGKLRPPAAQTAARKVRKQIAQAAGVDEKTLAVLTAEEIKERVSVSVDDVQMLNGIASGKNVPRNSVAILGAQKLKLSVAGLLTQNINVTGSLKGALDEVRTRIAQGEGSEPT